ncbi:MAG: hypothetical protein KDA28_03615, partial [Phycisphaerales bacterium]|nr:hypothetical protein [Phycisphaerales bacterium]
MRLVPFMCCCLLAGVARADLTGEVLLETAGRFHPVVVHFPIALLVVAGLIELFRLRKPADEHSDAAFVCLLIGGAAAIVGAWSGWMLEDSSPTGDDLIEWHRWLGVGVAGASVLAIFLSLGARGTKHAGLRNAYRLVLLATVGAVGVTGHLGGTMIYGEGFLTDPIREALRDDDD